MRFVLFFILFNPIGALAQNNPIFGGGNGDGFAHSVYLQDYILPSSSSIFIGGNGDIFALNEYASIYNLPINTAIFGGGSGDLYGNNTYEQTYNLPTFSSIFSGGNGDVFAQIEYEQDYILPINTSIFGGGDGSGDVIGCLVDTPAYLPVNIISFEAKRLNTESVNLKWQTAYEENNLGFEIWRKTLNNWKLVDFVDGRSPSFSKQEYVLLDMNSFKGVSYYKIKQLDFDGIGSMWTEIAIVNNTTIADLSLFPNPTSKTLTMFANKDLIKTITVYNSLGKSVLQLSPNARQVVTDVSSLRKGVYTIEVTTTNSVQSLRFIRN